MPVTRRFPSLRCSVCSCRVSCTGMCAHGCRVGAAPAEKKQSSKWPVIALLFVTGVLAVTFVGIGLAPQIPEDFCSDTLGVNDCFYDQVVRMNQTLVPVRANVSADVYAEALDAATLCYGSFDTYYSSIVFDSMQDDFFAGLLQQFRAIKERCQLDDDQYAELMAAYIQMLPYDYQASPAVKYPVVTAVGGAGDCDDFALLLAGLLVREGYDVCLLLYLDSGHMAVGIRCNESYAFPNTGGYAYIETTGGSLIVCGDYPMGMIRDSEVPTCIRIGNGTKMYTADRESNELFRYIYATYRLDEPGEMKHIVLNQPNGTEPAENMEVFTINAFDRGYLYRNLIESSA